ncbi:MAG: tRNA 4-thiouridine(8) synthase ThiI [Thermoplasmatota archaeon]
MRFIGLISGGIDSPVASHLMLEKGLEAVLLNMDNSPFSGDDESEKVNEIARRLTHLHPGRVRLLRAPHGLSLKSFAENSNEKYMCILCKKAMIGLADRLCGRENADFIVLGDSLGQVASQTLPNLAAVSAGITHPIVRPLIGFDKLDIEKIARDIGTFEISIRRTHGCTAAPRYPITHAENDKLLEEAGKGNLEEIMDEVLKSIVEVDLSDSVKIE